MGKNMRVDNTEIGHETGGCTELQETSVKFICRGSIC